ncbi:PLP-dependent aminotransferase family protein [Pelagibacterium sp. H642]|uniref:MocR-like pyridoxine biosynthesis transcription factor PdxR n=1 Tax=Pelagibacterium sp. H642 TaxID=1881069 RepID=UPI00281589CB|nr:PLP-dependent aminotransferase family protein [Pelagibacterium sp. H642]WMT89600.1 PLP-dependent aminotransferase family protein [Pelagibacterium sp. H642]
MLEGLIVIDPAGGPLPEQIYRAIGAAARSGKLKAGAVLPSSRQLAAGLGISRNSVNAGYELLRADGVVAVRPGAAPRIVTGTDLERASLSGAGDARGLSRRGEAIAVNLRGKRGQRHSGYLEPGAPDEALFPADLWARTLRRVARQKFGDAAIYEALEGLPRLKSVLADYLARQRGVNAGPDQILIVPSTQSGLALAAQCLSDPGDTGLVESPGYFGVRTAFAGAGLVTRALEVDGQGVDPSGIERSGARLVYVTPSHQYPTGARMPLQRRMDLLQAARRMGAIVLEDDYDSEFLWNGRAIAALQGISDGAEVIYLGTTAKSLLPGLRLAYMVVPKDLAGPLAQAQRNLGLRINIHTQAAFADLIESGALATHLKRIAKTYEERGRLLVETLRERFGADLEVNMPMGGLQVVARFARPRDDGPVAAALAAEGFETPSLSSYCAGEKRSGLIIGFADATPKRVARFADRLEQALV